MTTMRKLFIWISEFTAKWGDPPKTLPITTAELQDILTNERPTMCVQIAPNSTELFGLATELSPFAEGIRTKRLEVSIGQILSEYSIDECLKNNLEFVVQEQIRRLKAYILRDRVVVQVSLECDPWAGVKRCLKLTRRFPIRTVVRHVDCSVLYPYCKVQFPHNRHTVHFSIRPPNA